MSGPEPVVEPPPTPRSPIASPQLPRWVGPAVFLVVTGSSLLLLPSAGVDGAVGLEEGALLARLARDTSDGTPWDSVHGGVWRPLGRALLSVWTGAVWIGDTAPHEVGDTLRRVQWLALATATGLLACLALRLAHAPRRRPQEGDSTDADEERAHENGEDGHSAVDRAVDRTGTPAWPVAATVGIGFGALFAFHPARATDLAWTPHVHATVGLVFALAAANCVSWFPRSGSSGSPWRAVPCVLLACGAILVDPGLAPLPLALAWLAGTLGHRIPRRLLLLCGAVGLAALLRSVTGVPRSPDTLLTGLERWTLVVGAPLHEWVSTAALAPWTADLGPADALPVLRDTALVVLVGTWAVVGLRRGRGGARVALLYLAFTTTAWWPWVDGGDAVPARLAPTALLACGAATWSARLHSWRALVPPALALVAAATGLVLLRGRVEGWDSTEAVFRRIEGHAAGHPQVLAARGEAARRRAEHQVAEARLARALASLPHHGRAHLSLGRVRLDQGRPRDALSAFEAAVTHRPDLAAAHRELGLVQFRLRSQEDALRSLRTAVRLDPGSALSWLALADVLGRLGRDGEAEAARRRHAELVD